MFSRTYIENFENKYRGRRTPPSDEDIVLFNMVSWAQHLGVPATCYYPFFMGEPRFSVLLEKVHHHIINECYCVKLVNKRYSSREWNRIYNPFDFKEVIPYKIYLSQSFHVEPPKKEECFRILKDTDKESIRNIYWIYKHLLIENNIKECHAANKYFRQSPFELRFV